MDVLGDTDSGHLRCGANELFMTRIDVFKTNECEKNKREYMEFPGGVSILLILEIQLIADITSISKFQFELDTVDEEPPCECATANFHLLFLFYFILFDGHSDEYAVNT